MKRKYIFMGGSLLILVIASSLFLSGMMKRKEVKLDVSENLELRFSGSNGKGEPEIVQNNVAYSGKDETILRFIDSIGYRFSKDSELSNGEIITVTVMYDADLKKLGNIELLGTNREYTVSGLTGENSLYKDIIVEDEDGFMRLDEKVVIDGIEIPDYLTSKSERESYVEYVKKAQENSNRDTSTDGPVKEQWMQGNSESVTKRKDTSFYLEDYPTQVDAWFAASNFGSTSSQKYKIDMITENGKVIGFKVLFEQLEEDE